MLAGQREVRRLRRGLRLLRPVALRGGGHADARDDGARADPRARAGGRGGGRAPLLHGHPGPGALEARLREDRRRRAAGRRAHQPEALRVDRPHLARSRAAAARRRRPARPPQRRDARAPTTPRSRPRSATRAASARSTRSRRPGSRPASAASSTSASRPRQRVEMAFELAEIDPTSVPINLLNPRAGTKFGDRELMDPWEVVKWVAIFRLILPDALFRLCGGRVENLDELQPLAVKAGLNGVMMGNFLTTLGAEPADDRAMFEELGLNVARQPDNGANPRPDNRSGWLDGETPQTPIDELIDSQAEANFWDPSTQLRVIKKKRKPPPYPEPSRPQRRPAGATDAVSDVAERLEELRRAGLERAPAPGRGPAGPAGDARRRRGPPALLQQLPRPRRPPARAPGGRRRGRALRRRRGRVAADLREHEPPRPASRSGSPAFIGHRGGAAVRLGLPRQPRRRSPRWRGRGEVVFSDELNHASIIDGCRLSRARDASSTATATSSTWRGGCARRAAAAALIVTDGVFSMDGDVAPLAELVELARRHGCRLMVDEAHGVGRARARAGAAPSPRRGWPARSTSSSARSARRSGSYGAYVCGSRRARRAADEHRAAVHLLHRACRRPSIGAALAALDAARRAARAGRAAAPKRRHRCARPSPPTGLDAGGSRTQIVPVIVGDARRAMALCERALEGGVFAQAIRPPTVPRGPRGCGSR